jgi:hypothetical protein
MKYCLIFVVYVVASLPATRLAVFAEQSRKFAKQVRVGAEVADV